GGLNVLQELLAVPIDVFDPHRRDHLAELAEDDVLGLPLDFLGVQPQQTDGRILRDLVIGADGHGEDTGYIDANVLTPQGPFERNLDLDRLQVEVRKVLDERQDKGGAAMDTLRRVASADLAVNDQHPVTGTAFVTAKEQRREA